MRKEEKTELTRERILIAAMKEFGENGYAGSSLNSICASGIPKGLLYHNFNSKDALYLACMERSFGRYVEFMGGQDRENDLNKYMDARFRFFRENEQEARLIFEAILQPPQPLKERILSIKAEFEEVNRRMYLDVLSQITLREGVSKEEALEYFTFVQTMFNGYFCSPAYDNMLFPEKMKMHEERLRRILDYMIYGIAERRSLK